ncbi:GNAT family acetyltransferase [Colletotrichum tofieldiae]|uniref:GNAT family acetyltransferase n=1 Tax=Colletotrichum tofieldiae TaxID=708197 RepID=A0A166P2M5_9PEZI|nr:GNAT family acetyltransferase [Colletotrichum tofieldiae]
MAAIYTTVPDGLTALLEAHLPRPLPVLRRLQFTRFKGGMRPTARIIFASDSPLTSEQTGQSTPQRNFTVAYIDFGSNMETQLFMYSTLENGVAATEEERETAELQIMAALDAVRQVSREQPDNRAYPGGCLVGTLATVTRETMIKRGVTVRPRAVFEYEKWLFRVEEVPEFNVALPEGATWAPATERDCEVVISRTTVPRQVKTLMSFPSLFLKLEDGTPIAWSFLGTDGSLSSLHCEPPYRQRGYAKALASRLFKRSASDYGSDGWVCADVAPENLGSKGMCKSLNGRHAWNCSWNIIQLDEEEAKN